MKKEKITTHFGPTDNSDVITKGYRDEKRKIIKNKRSLIKIRKRLQRV